MNLFVFGWTNKVINLDFTDPPTNIWPIFPPQLNVFSHTGDSELSRLFAVPALPSYIQWKMEDDHTYHNMKVHNNTIQKWI